MSTTQDIIQPGRSALEPARLDDLLADAGIEIAFLPRGMAVRTQAAWVVPGEDHLSYTTLTRLVECCRERHWMHDVLPAAGGAPIEAIARGFSARFYQPVAIGSLIEIVYRVCAVRSRMYQLRFTIQAAGQQVLHARYTLDCVFYAAAAHRACRVTPAVAACLTALEQDMEALVSREPA